MQNGVARNIGIGPRRIDETRNVERPALRDVDAEISEPFASVFDAPADFPLKLANLLIARAEYPNPGQAQLTALANQILAVEIGAVVAVIKADAQTVAAAETVIFIGKRPDTLL